MTFIKKYWVFLIVIILLIIAIIFLWRKETPVIQDNTIAIHQFDSLKYIHSNDSLKNIITILEKEIVKRETAYTRTLANVTKKINSIQTLPAQEVVDEFSDQIQHELTIENRNDTVVIVPLQGVKNAVVLIYERKYALMGVEYYMGQDSLKNEVIVNQKQLLDIKDTRIVKLTDEFYQSQQVITGLKGSLEKEKRKVRNRNTLIGVTAGIGAVAILVAALK